ncbi:MAG TPA: site-specific integrase [Mycobacterium sp.]|nr:site-specific integrase [Mycobacterium sp.]
MNRAAASARSSPRQAFQRHSQLEQSEGDFRRFASAIHQVACDYEAYVVSITSTRPQVDSAVNDYLGYLADRGYSPRTLRAYAFYLLAFARWLVVEGLAVDDVTTQVLLRFLAFCRSAARRAGRAATCTRSATAATSGMRRRRSTAGSLRSPGCSPAARCGTGRRPTRCRTGRRRAAGTVNLSNPRAIFAGSPPRFTRSRVTYEAYVVSRTSTGPQVDSAVLWHADAATSS